MADPVLLKLRVSPDEDSEYTILMHPASGMMQGDIPLLTRLTAPSITGSGAAGTNHNYTAGTNSAGALTTAQWCIDGNPVATAVPGTPYVPDASANGHSLSVREQIAGFAGTALDAESNIIAVTDATAPSFPANLSQAELDQFDVFEITDHTDPDAGTGGKCRLIVGTVPAWADGVNFKMQWGASQTSGGVPDSATDIAAGGTYLRNNVQPVGSKRHIIFYAYRIADGARQEVTPPVGHTGGIAAHQLTLTPIPGNDTKGQGIMTIQGLDDGTTPQPGIWPMPSTIAVNEAKGANLTRMDITNVGAGVKGDTSVIGNTCLMRAYALWKGHSSIIVSDTRAQLDAYLNPNTMPFCVAGPIAARETAFLPFSWLVQNTPSMGISSDERRKLDVIRDALLAGNAFIVSDKRPNHSLLGSKTTVKGIGSNIGTTPIMTVMAAACLMGVQNAINFLENFSMATMRTRIADDFGTGSQLYLSFNWRNEGMSATDATNYNRAKASSEAPTDAQVQDALKGWSYYGNTLPNFEALAFNNVHEALNNTLSPDMYSQGAQPYVGLVQWAATSKADAANGLTNQKIIVNGQPRGFCISNGPATPHLGDVGCMIWEWCGQDAEGLRMSVPYGEWSSRMVNAGLMCMALTEQVNFDTPLWQDFLTRWAKARDIFKHWNINDFNSIAHASTSANGGAGQPALWSTVRDNWKPNANVELWDAVLERLIV